MERDKTPHSRHLHRRVLKTVLFAVALSLFLGCALFDPKPAGTPILRDQPKELAKMSLPQYYLEPPDIITVEAIHIVPRAPYVLRTYDVVFLDIMGTPPEETISGNYTVHPGGQVHLGANYGSVVIGGLTSEDAEKEILRTLRQRLRTPSVSLRITQMSEMQQINGEHLIAPDGYITLGSYGRVYVNSLTLPECREAVELHLSTQLEHPIVAVDVFAYNSKEYYVVLQGGPTGDQVISFPYTGNETVLKAIANVNGLAPTSSKRIWIARPIANTNKPLILPVDWVAVTAYGAPQTNYQVLPGDRVFVSVDNWIASDQRLAKIIAPFERIMGFMLLGATTTTRYSGAVLKGGGDQRNR